VTGKICIRRFVLQNKVFDMKRKRARGGGRKSRSGPTSSLTFRIPDQMRRQLESEAAAKDATVSERLLWHLSRSFNRQREEERDPALNGLLIVIASLAEATTGGELLSDKYYRSEVQRKWRTDLFNFRAFKFAVKKLLDTLEEPPESTMTQENHENYAREASVGDSPEFQKLFLEINKSPEAMGAFNFKNVWTRFTHSDRPFTESERSMMNRFPDFGRAMEREYYDFQKARKALELEPEREDEFEAIKRIMKDRNLSGKDNLPPDLEEALRLINDRRGALLEKAKGLPPGEGLKLFRSEKLPTIDEALKLLKSKKPKDKKR